MSTTEPIIVPAPVLVEVDYWITRRLGALAFVALLDDFVEGVYHLEELIPDDYVRVRELCAQYADSDIGFVDAAVLAVTERLEETRLATLDHRHFRMLRPRHVAALELLPERLGA